MMNHTVKLLQKNSLFFAITLLFTGILMCFGSLFPNALCFMLLNSFRCDFFNMFFEIVTLFGDGTFVILLAFVISVFFRKSRTLALLIILSYILSGLFAQVFKALVSAPRPKEFFKLNPYYNYYLDAFIHSRGGFRSFPSGHSASAFAMVTVLSLYLKQKKLCLPLLLFAILVGYSRIYLAHHFLPDVIGGIVIGVLTGTLSVVVVKTFNIKVSKKSLFKKRKKGKTATEPVVTLGK